MYTQMLSFYSTSFSLHSRKTSAPSLQPSLMPKYAEISHLHLCTATMCYACTCTCTVMIVYIYILSLHMYIVPYLFQSFQKISGYLSYAKSSDEITVLAGGTADDR